MDAMTGEQHGEVLDLLESVALKLDECIEDPSSSKSYLDFSLKDLKVLRITLATYISDVRSTFGHLLALPSHPKGNTKAAQNNLLRLRVNSDDTCPLCGK